MAFFRVTYNDKYRFATLHNLGCTFHCKVCSYKLRSGADGIPGMSYPPPMRPLTVDEIKDALRSVELDKVYFMGGEPTVSRELPELLRYIKQELEVSTLPGAYQRQRDTDS